VHEAVQRLGDLRLWTWLIVGRDPRQVHLHEILGRQIARPELVLDVGDGGFDHLKTIAMVIVRDGGKNERQNREEKRAAQPHGILLRPRLPRQRRGPQQLRVPMFTCTARPAPSLAERTRVPLDLTNVGWSGGRWSNRRGRRNDVNAR